jgi:hypothetical protein
MLELMWGMRTAVALIGCVNELFHRLGLTAERERCSAGDARGSIGIVGYRLVCNDIGCRTDNNTVWSTSWRTDDIAKIL